MYRYATRAYNILRNRGPRSLVAHSLKFLAFKIDPHGIPPHLIESPALPGRLNAIGAVAARTIPDDLDPVVHVPLSELGEDIIFDKVAAVLHIFYPELTREMISYVQNIPISFGIFITTDTEEKKSDIYNIISDMKVDALEIVIRVTPNVGRDIAPKYIAFKDVYDRYDCFIHLHSKKSLHDGYGDSWRKYLFYGLLGSKEIAESNLRILSRDKTGIVYQEHADEVREQINWGYDFPIAKELLSKIGISLDANTILEFPSGSMFWGRSAAIRPILNLNLQFSDFPEENGQVDGTIAHAIERSLLLFVESGGFGWVRTTTRAVENNKPNKKRKFIPLLGSEHSASCITAHRIPESYRVLFAPDFSTKPRLNLILPTVNPAEVFGGISTALKVFDQLRAASIEKIDVRIIVTDAQVTSITDSLKNFKIQHLGNEEPAEEVLLDATNRMQNRLELRANDVFIATAWWTALNAFRAHDAQKVLFQHAPKVIYLMQDFEPDFYGWSTRYALAESTYLRGEDTIALINSEELMKHFAAKYNHPTRMVIPYRVNAKVDTSLTHSIREKIILFYSRPSAVRNCFESGIDGIALWARRNPVQAAHWKVYCIGESFDPSLASAIPNVVVTGKMTLDEYAALLSKASVGVSLMISPHPSYPPLEMAYAGVRTLTNKYTGKDLSIRCKNLTSIDIPTPELIAKELEDQVNVAEQTMVGRVSPIRNKIADIDTDVNHFEPAEVLSILGIGKPT